MSFEQKELWLKGREFERERIIKIIRDMNDHGMTHSEACLKWHSFADKAERAIKAEQSDQNQSGTTCCTTRSMRSTDV
jgi:hypothetical protein